MWTKVIFGLISIALMTSFVGAVVLKLKDPALAVVVLIGLSMTLYDFVLSLPERD